WVLRCDSLCTHVTHDGGLCYYSEARPTILLQGKRRVVAFAPHAIDRIAERLAAPVPSWATAGDIFAYVNYMRYFEPAELYPHRPAFSLYERCQPRFASDGYA